MELTEADEEIVISFGRCFGDEGGVGKSIASSMIFAGGCALDEIATPTDFEGSRGLRDHTTKELGELREIRDVVETGLLGVGDLSITSSIFSTEGINIASSFGGEEGGGGEGGGGSVGSWGWGEKVDSSLTSGVSRIGSTYSEDITTEGGGNGEPDIEVGVGN